MTFFGLLALLFSPLFADPRDVALVARLGSDDWRERRDADQLLRIRGLKAKRAVMKGMESEDVEIRRSCASIREQAVEEAIASLGVMPMLDALWYDTNNTNGVGYSRDNCPAAYNLLDWRLDRVGRDCYPWDNYRKATGEVVRELIEAGISPDRLRPVLAEMRRRDAVFLKGYGYMPPAD